jgi:hypothetical protein
MTMYWSCRTRLLEHLNFDFLTEPVMMNDPPNRIKLLYCCSLNAGAQFSTIIDEAWAARDSTEIILWRHQIPLASAESLFW